MRTVIIWNEFGEHPLGWFAVDGDLSHLDRHLINSTETPDDIAVEINSLVWTDDGDRRQEVCQDFNLMPRGEDVKIIVCGMLP